MRLVMLSVVAVCLCVLVCLVRALIFESFDLETLFLVSWYVLTHSLLFVYYSILFTLCPHFVYCVFVYFVYSSIHPLAAILQ